MVASLDKHIVLIYVLALSTCSYISQGCGDNWVTYDGSCYLFGHQTMTFTDAVFGTEPDTEFRTKLVLKRVYLHVFQHFCRIYNAHLVHISNSHENDFLKDNLKHIVNPHQNWWIGLTDQVVENDWRWLDTDTHPTYKDWSHGEPNNQGGVGEENCAVMYWLGDFSWNDISCTYHYRPICEIREGLSISGVVG